MYIVYPGVYRIHVYMYIHFFSKVPSVQPQCWIAFAKTCQFFAGISGSCIGSRRVCSPFNSPPVQTTTLPKPPKP